MAEPSPRPARPPAEPEAPEVSPDPSVTVPSAAPAPPAVSIPVAPVAAGPGIEVLPLAEETTGLPASEALPDLLQDPEPVDAEAAGRLVAGLPAVISPLPDSAVTASSVSASDETVTASLAATTSAVGMKVLAHYVAAFGAVGLSGTPATTSGDATVQTFYRGNDSVIVTIESAADGLTAYTLRGLFSAGA
ncbi:hypothetical protein [Cryobacterium melibiosiphilum]|uniref:hypothetical protein n=1 Tax=Cryobacterium melibiosiphilum TaxID=995039 RepID=UPI001313FDCA|nr:hypothetical protein [Cryobacterium melibiosiphilum]